MRFTKIWVRPSRSLRTSQNRSFCPGLGIDWRRELCKLSSISTKSVIRSKRFSFACMEKLHMCCPDSTMHTTSTVWRVTFLASRMPFMESNQSSKVVHLSWEWWPKGSFMETDVSQWCQSACLRHWLWMWLIFRKSHQNSQEPLSTSTRSSLKVFRRYWWPDFTEWSSSKFRPTKMRNERLKSKLELEKQLVLLSPDLQLWARKLHVLAW